MRPVSYDILTKAVRRVHITLLVSVNVLVALLALLFWHELSAYTRSACGWHTPSTGGILVAAMVLYDAGVVALLASLRKSWWIAALVVGFVSLAACSLVHLFFLYHVAAGSMLGSMYVPFLWLVALLSPLALQVLLVVLVFVRRNAHARSSLLNYTLAMHAMNALDAFSDGDEAFSRDADASPTLKEPTASELARIMALSSRVPAVPAVPAPAPAAAGVAAGATVAASGSASAASAGATAATAANATPAMDGAPLGGAPATPLAASPAQRARQHAPQARRRPHAQFSRSALPRRFLLSTPLLAALLLLQVALMLVYYLAAGHPGFYNSTGFEFFAYTTRRPKVVAHRTAPPYGPPNSAWAVRKLCGYVNPDMVELDVRVTNDSRLVAIHDARLGAVTSQPRYADLDVHDISAKTAGNVNIGDKWLTLDPFGTVHDVFFTHAEVSVARKLRLVTFEALVEDIASCYKPGYISKHSADVMVDLKDDQLAPVAVEVPDDSDDGSGGGSGSGTHTEYRRVFMRRTVDALVAAFDSQQFQGYFARNIKFYLLCYSQECADYAYDSTRDNRYVLLMTPVGKAPYGDPSRTRVFTENFARLTKLRWAEQGRRAAWYFGSPGMCTLLWMSGVSHLITDRPAHCLTTPGVYVFGGGVYLTYIALSVVLNVLLFLFDFYFNRRHIVWAESWAGLFARRVLDCLHRLSRRGDQGPGRGVLDAVKKWARSLFTRRKAAAHSAHSGHGAHSAHGAGEETTDTGSQEPLIKPADSSQDAAQEHA